jgi:hypothetical protein
MTKVESTGGILADALSRTLKADEDRADKLMYIYKPGNTDVRLMCIEDDVPKLAVGLKFEIVKLNRDTGHVVVRIVHE